MSLFCSYKLHHSNLLPATLTTTLLSPKELSHILAMWKYEVTLKEGRFAVNKSVHNNIVEVLGCRYIMSLSSLAEFGTKLRVDVGVE